MAVIKATVLLCLAFAAVAHAQPGGSTTGLNFIPSGSSGSSTAPAFVPSDSACQAIDVQLQASRPWDNWSSWDSCLIQGSVTISNFGSSTIFFNTVQLQFFNNQGNQWTTTASCIANNSDVVVNPFGASYTCNFQATLPGSDGLNWWNTQCLSYRQVQATAISYQTAAACPSQIVSIDSSHSGRYYAGNTYSTTSASAASSAGSSSSGGGNRKMLSIAASHASEKDTTVVT